MGGGRDTYNSDYDMLFRIAVIGDSGVGKTSLLLRLADDTFSEIFLATIGIDFKIRRLRIDDKDVKLQLWDTAGQERFRHITSSFYRGAHGVILVYDVTNQDSFNNVTDWIKEVEKYSSPNTKLMLVGTKSDLNARRIVDYSMGKELADRLGIPFVEASAKTSSNVEELFVLMASHLKSKYDTEQKLINRPEIRLSDGREIKCRMWDQRCFCF